MTTPLDTPTRSSAHHANDAHASDAHTTKTAKHDSTKHESSKADDKRVAFADLALSPQLQKNVQHEGYTHPTPIQAQAIPHVLAGRDVLGCAQTGTGKTAAFSLPILHRLSADHQPHPNQHHHRPIRALILSPTRELSLQIEESLRTYGKGTGLRGVCIFGGVGQGNQTRALEAGVDVVVATPGRLIDLMQQGYVDLSKVQVFVLDEADRMLDMGFIQPIRQIAAATPKVRQTLLFSATMPKEIRHLADSLLNNPVSVQVAAVSSTPDKIDQSVYMVAKPSKPALLVNVLQNTHVDRVIVFTRTKHGADRVQRHLNFAGINAESIHGDKRQSQRQKALMNFRSGKSPVMVATDIAARGIDVDGISHVINYDIPNEPESYVHRIGRTARAGAEGKAIAFCDPSGDERGFLRDVEKLMKRQIPVVQLPELPPPPPRSERFNNDRYGNDRPSNDRFGSDRRGNDRSRGSDDRSRESRDQSPFDRPQRLHPFEKHGFGNDGRSRQAKQQRYHAEQREQRAEGGEGHASRPPASRPPHAHRSEHAAAGDHAPRSAPRRPTNGPVGDHAPRGDKKHAGSGPKSSARPAHAGGKPEVKFPKKFGGPARTGGGHSGGTGSPARPSHASKKPGQGPRGGHKGPARGR